MTDTAQSYRLAQQVLEHVRRDLGLPRLRIRWCFLPSEWGMVEPDDPTLLLLNTKLLGNPDQLIETVAHEARHAWRIVVRGDPVYHEGAERDARHYGHRIWARWSDR